jgi:small subunit ribosomal protein SAe
VEAAYVNIPTIALVDSDSSLQYVDVAIPCNNRSTQSISMIFWLLAREVKILRGELGKSEDWDVMVDLFFYKELDKAIENEEEEEEGVKPEEGKTHGKEKAWDQQGEEVEEGGDWDA